MTTSPSHSALRELAQFNGIQLEYTDIFGDRREAQTEPLLKVLGELGVALEREQEARGALRQTRLDRWRSVLPPALAVWQGTPATLELRLPAKLESATLQAELELEHGDTRAIPLALRKIRTSRNEQVEGQRFTLKRLHLPDDLPEGYHRLRLELDGVVHTSHLLVAPPRVWSLPQDNKLWGVFLPLYALHSRRSAGAGDFTDMERLCDWMGSFGAGVFATLPLLAGFLDEPYEPSPYSPASRLFWNEMYIDPARCPELEDCPEARVLLESELYQRQRASLRQDPLVHYRVHSVLCRRALEPLVRSFFERAQPGRREAFEQFLKDRPDVTDYARFRAVCERERTGWPVWPAGPRQGSIQATDYDSFAEQFHLYAQWIAEEQIARIDRKLKQFGPGMYLDLPLGVHRDSYDVWRDRQSFALGVSGGAPPDPFFSEGQDWGFPPLHPQNMRLRGFRYFRACLRHHLKHAGLLRLDHVMGLHRLFWVPRGHKANEGVYVNYPYDELYAVLCIESNRAQAAIVGEDLGTVPEEVRKSMQMHGILRMFVTQFEVQPDRKPPHPPAPANQIASLNTHDMPTFTAWWETLDLVDRVDLGILDDAGVEQEWRHRHRTQQVLLKQLSRERHLKDNPTTAEALRACLRKLASSPAAIVLVNLEDLWQETAPQNVPGTWRERPNWRRKAALSFEQFTRMPDVLTILKEIDKLRRRTKH